MQKNVLLLVLLGLGLCSNLAQGTPHAGAKEVPMRWELADDEYLRYKKRADAFFDQGDYLNALRQYHNCLEVPTYENDPYAKGRIALVEKLLKLREEAQKALKAGKGEEAVGLFEQIVAENPKDSITKVNLTDYWTGEATRYYEQQNYEEAKVRYLKALQYAVKPALIQLQIQNCEAFIKLKANQAPKTEEVSPKVVSKDPPSEPDSKPTTTRPTSPEKAKTTPVVTKNRRMVPKLLVGAVGVGAGAYAYTLHNQYQTKLDEVNRIANQADPDGDHIILSAGEYQQWQTAYNEAVESKRNRSKFVASLGVVGVAALTEVLLLTIPKRKPTRLSIESSTQSLGLAVCYSFK